MKYFSRTNFCTCTICNFGINSTSKNWIIRPIGSPSILHIPYWICCIEFIIACMIDTIITIYICACAWSRNCKIIECKCSWTGCSSRASIVIISKNTVNQIFNASVGNCSSLIIPISYITRKSRIWTVYCCGVIYTATLFGTVIITKSRIVYIQDTTIFIFTTSTSSGSIFTSILCNRWFFNIRFTPIV